MRFLLSILLLGLLSCDESTPIPAYQGCLAENDQWIAPNGRMLTVTEIKENFCPCNANCIWTPYLEVTLRSGDDSLRLSYYHEDSVPSGVSEETLAFYPPNRTTYQGAEVEFTGYDYAGENTCEASGRYDFCVELRVTEPSRP